MQIMGKVLAPLRTLLSKVYGAEEAFISDPSFKKEDIGDIQLSERDRILLALNEERTMYLEMVLPSIASFGAIPESSDLAFDPDELGRLVIRARDLFDMYLIRREKEENKEEMWFLKIDGLDRSKGLSYEVELYEPNVPPIKLNLKTIKKDAIVFFEPEVIDNLYRLLKNADDMATLKVQVSNNNKIRFSYRNDGGISYYEVPEEKIVTSNYFVEETKSTYKAGYIKQVANQLRKMPISTVGIMFAENLPIVITSRVAIGKLEETTLTIIISPYVI